MPPFAYRVEGLVGGVAIDVGPKAGGDAVAAGGPIESGTYLFNNVTWDRARSVTGDTMTPTGLLAAAGMVFSPGLLNHNRIREVSGGLDNVGTAGYQGVAILGIDPATGGMNRIRVPVAGDVVGAVRVVPQNSPQRAGIAGGANAIATMTLPAGGVALYQNITYLRIARVATAALAGGALLAVTTTNLTGQQWRTGNQASITVSTYDGYTVIDLAFAIPWRAVAANTAVTFVGPAAGAAVSWDMQCEYYLAP